MKNATSICLCFLFLASCSPKKATPESKQTVISDTLVEPMSKALPTLVKIPDDLYVKLDIDEWERLTRWTDDFENFTKLDTKGVELFLNGLDFQTRSFYKTKFPKKLEIFPVRSRLKVVLVQVQKAKFYAKTQQMELLTPALDTMYMQYNNFLNRIISIGDEETLETSDVD